MKKTRGGLPAIITYEYECWKCNEWHKTISESDADFFDTISYLNTAVRVLDREVPRLMSNADKTMWLIPLPKRRGLLVSWTSRLFSVLPWRTARWEFADHNGGSDLWNEEVLTLGR